MKSFLQAAACFSLIASCVAAPLAGQQPAPSAGSPSGGVLIAVIDIGHVFKNHQRFQQQMDGIRSQIKAFESEVAAERQQLTRGSEKLRELNPGSPEYKSLEEELARKMSDLQVRMQLKRKEMLSQEAESYYTAYQEVQTAVGAVASSYNIGLVLSYDREDIDPTDRASVLRGVNRAVVLQRNLDISQLVLDQLPKTPAPQNPPTVSNTNSSGGINR